MISGTVQNALLVAEDNTGGVIATSDFKTNGWETNGETHEPSQSMVATISGGVSELLIPSGNRTPRAVVLTMIDPLGIEDTTVELIGFTCDSTARFAIPDSSKEWRYELTTFAEGYHPSCGNPEWFDYEIGYHVASLTVPAEIYVPQIAEAVNDTLANVNSPDIAKMPRSSFANNNLTTARLSASPSIFDTFNLASISNKFTTSAIASSHQQFLFRYEAFIPEKYIYTPTTHILGHLYRFGGDNRTIEMNGTSRMWIVQNFHFGGSGIPPAPYTDGKGVGVTDRWICQMWSINTCGNYQSDQAADSGVFATNLNRSASRVSFSITASAGNPLFALAPKIDAGTTVDIRWGGSTAHIVHDRMPIHALKWGIPESEYMLIYASRTKSAHCLAGFLHGCTVRATVQL